MFIREQEGTVSPMKDLDKWFELLGDAERGEVMKTHIKESEETQRTLINSEGYHVVRFFKAVAVVIVVITLAVAADHMTEIVVKSHTPTVTISASASVLK